MTSPLDRATREWIEAIVGAAPELREEQVNTLQPLLSQPAESTPQQVERQERRTAA